MKARSLNGGVKSDGDRDAEERAEAPESLDDVDGAPPDRLERAQRSWEAFAHFCARR